MLCQSYPSNKYNVPLHKKENNVQMITRLKTGQVVVEDLYMSLCAFHLAQLISTVLRPCFRLTMAVNMVTVPETESGTKIDHTQKRRFRHGAVIP